MLHVSTKSYLRSVVCAALLFLCPATTAAIPLSEYHQNLKNAIAALEKLNESVEEESTDDYQNRFNNTLEQIRTSFPKNQTVEAEGEVCNVDNSSLHKKVDELKSGVEDVDPLLEVLQAMESRVAQRQEMGQPAQSKDDARKRLETILARPEYATTTRGPNPLTRLFRALIEWLKKFFPEPKQIKPGSLDWLTLIAKIGVVAAALALLVFLTKLLLNRFKRTRKIKARKKQEPRIVLGERLEPEQTATDLLSEAEALARSGDLRAAIRKGYIALLVELGDRKIISLAQHKTNRDYLNAVRELPPLHSRMAGLTSSFERHWYGFVDASQNDWQDFRDGYLAALRSGT